MQNYERMTKPADYAVYCEISPYPNCGFTGVYTSRIGPAKDMAAAKELIAKTQRAMGDTYGGLIEPARGRRTYRVFRSLGWEEVKS